MAYYTGLEYSPMDVEPQAMIPQASPVGYGNLAPQTVGAQNQQMGNITRGGLGNVPNPVYQNIQNFGSGYGDQTMLGSAANRGALRSYHDFENQYGQGAVPYALRSEAEGGAGMDPNSQALFNPNIDPQALVRGKTSFYGGPGEFFKSRDALHDALSGQVINQYRPGGRDLSGTRSYDLFGPLQGAINNPQWSGSPAGMGTGQFENWFGDDYLNQQLAGARNQLGDISAMPTLDAFRRDFILGARPSNYHNPMGAQGSYNQSMVQWANAARPYLGDQYLRSQLQGGGLNPWF